MSEATSAPAPVAMITGASRGIGVHLAQGFAQAGYRVALVARDAAKLETVATHIRNAGGVALPLELDVTDALSVDAVVDTVIGEFGSIDALINNAGVIETEAVIWDSNPDEWWNVIETNVRGPYLLSRAVSRAMKYEGGGRIINLNSGSGGSDSIDLSAYHASKSALARITNAIALAGRNYGIYAFDLAPGVVATDMTASMAMHKDRKQWTSPDEVVELALALASGKFDDWSGCMVRAGTDTPDSLKKAAANGVGGDARRLRWTSYGDGDPIGH